MSQQWSIWHFFFPNGKEAQNDKEEEKDSEEEIKVFCQY